MRLVASWFWQLIPGNPMLQRIVFTSSRRMPHFWLRLGFLGALIVLLLVALFAGGAFFTTGDAGQLAAAGSQLFATIAYGQLVLLCLLTPVFLGAALVSERSGRTMEVLLTTPMSSLQIVLGSLLGRLFFLFALLISSLPLMALVRLLGGVRGESMFVAYAVAALLLFFLGAVAVALSSWRVGGRSAVLFFVIGVGGYLLLVYGIDFLLLRALDPGRSTWLTPLHPMLVLDASVNPASYRPPTMPELDGYPWLLAWYRAHPLPVFSLATLGLGSLLLLLSTLTMRSGLTERVSRSREPAARRSSEVWSNPVAWRACQRLGRGWLAWGVRLLLPLGSVLIVSLVLVLHAYDQLQPSLGVSSRVRLTSYDLVHTLVLLLVGLQMSLGLLIGLFYASSTVAREREDGTLDLLLTTPIGAKAYLWGKVRGLLSGLLPMAGGAIATLAVPALYSLIGGWSGWASATYTFTSTVGAGGSFTREVPLVLPEAPLWLALTYVPMLAAAITIGLGRSITAKSVLLALVPTLLICLGLLGLSAVIGISAGQSISQFGLVINSLNPFTHLVFVTMPWELAADFAAYPVTGRVSLGMGSLLAALAFGAFVYGRMALTISGFDHAVRKADT
ncbi:hypothetical protein [Mucisphaera sp.]|uniref:hypothetical protein n=1 Tax=Mucisphaera sp. TaxID=2913024 RepID=UPI003D0F78BB